MLGCLGMSNGSQRTTSSIYEIGDPSVVSSVGDLNPQSVIFFFFSLRRCTRLSSGSSSRSGLAKRRREDDDLPPLLLPLGAPARSASAS